MQAVSSTFYHFSCTRTAINVPAEYIFRYMNGKGKVPFQRNVRHRGVTGSETGQILTVESRYFASHCEKSALHKRIPARKSTYRQFHLHFICILPLFMYQNRDKCTWIHSQVHECCFRYPQRNLGNVNSAAISEKCSKVLKSALYSGTFIAVLVHEKW